MNIVVLHLDQCIGRMLREVLELEGYVVVATQDAGEVVRAIEEGEGRSLLLADNFLTNPAAREALVRMIGLWSARAAASPYAGPSARRPGRWGATGSCTGCWTRPPCQHRTSIGPASGAQVEAVQLNGDTERPSVQRSASIT